MNSLDQTLFLALNGPADPARATLWLALLSAKYLFLLAPLHIALVWVGGTRAMRFVALAGLIAMAAALLFSGLVGLGHALTDHRPSSAFPSNHAIVCFSWAATLAVFGRSALAVAMGCLGLLVGWARIYLGIHYPLDILGALVISAAFAFAVAKLMRRVGQPLLERAEVVGDMPRRWWRSRLG